MIRTIKDNNGKNYKIAENENDFIDSLFIAGGTCDGYIIKKNKKSITFKIEGDSEYTINKFGVICKTKVIGDKKWFFHSSFEYVSSRVFVDTLTKKKEYDFNNNENIFYFK